MQQRHLGGTGLKVSRLGLGTMTWGRDTDEHEARDQLTAFVEAGGTLLDTAAGYANGDSERVIGSLLGDVVHRDEVVLATKAGISRVRGERETNASRGLPAPLASTPRCSASASTTSTCGRCTPGSTTPRWRRRSPRSTSRLSSGRAAYVGISNYTGWQTARAATWQQAVPGAGPDRLQPGGVLPAQPRRGGRGPDPAARALGVGVLPWSPLGRGVLTGKYRTGTPADSRAASPHFAAFVGQHLDERSQRIVEAVVRAGEGLGLDPLEVALAWVRDRPGVTAPIVGARTADQLRAM